MNQGHRDFQSLALPTELTRHAHYLVFSFFCFISSVGQNIVGFANSTEANVACILFDFSLLVRLVKYVVDFVNSNRTNADKFIISKKYA